MAVDIHPITPGFAAEVGDVDLSRGLAGDDLEAATRRMNAFIEARVDEMPAQYLWSHKRFKTRPPGEPSFYPAKVRRKRKAA